MAIVATNQDEPIITIEQYRELMQFINNSTFDDDYKQALINDLNEGITESLYEDIKFSMSINQQSFRDRVDLGQKELKEAVKESVERPNT